MLDVDLSKIMFTQEEINEIKHVSEILSGSTQLGCFNVTRIDGGKYVVCETERADISKEVWSECEDLFMTVNCFGVLASDVAKLVVAMRKENKPINIVEISTLAYRVYIQTDGHFLIEKEI